MSEATGGSADTGMWRVSPRRLAVVLAGCAVLGVGVAMLLTADLGSDGYSTLLNGTALAMDVSFLVASALIGVLFLTLAAAGGVYPGIGTVAQLVVVGVTVTALLAWLDTPSTTLGQVLLLISAFPVLAIGVALYLGTHTGAGPIEAAALAWDPPIPFKWSYNLVQGVSALVGWLLGGTVGVGTIAVIVLLGPAIALAARLMRQEIDGPQQ